MKNTQIELIKQHLENGGTITQKEAATFIFGNCWRLSSVIKRLRDRGMSVKTELVDNKNRGKHAKYSL